MIFFYTSSAKHLQKDLPGIELGKYFVKNFCDGELYLKLDYNIENKEVCVISSTQSPTDNIIELTFLLDALTKAGAKKINLFFTYFGYARQDRINESGEVLSAQVVCNFFKQFNLNKIYILHPHSNRLHEFLNFQEIIFYEIYYTLLADVNTIVAPDKGAINICQKIAKESNKECAILQKHRPTQEIAKIIKLAGEVKNKNVLIIDDIITTGNTILKATNFLLEAGAKSVKVFATHGLFCPDAIKSIEQSAVKEVYITNSLEQKISSSKIKVLNLGDYLVDFLK